MAAAADDAGPAVIGYVGDPDTFAEAVAVELGRRLVGAAAEVQPFGMVGQLAAAVAAGQVSAGVTAIERPAQGLVPGVYDELVARPALKIVAEALYCERPCLATASPTLAVATLPSVAAPACAFDQFAAFFANELPRTAAVYDARTSERPPDGLADVLTESRDVAGAPHSIPVTSYAAAAAAVAAGTAAAAVTTARAAERHQLTVVLPDIAGHRASATRYVAVAARALASAASRSNQQTSLVLTARNHANVLFQTVSCFTLRELFVTRIESRPSARSGPVTTLNRPWEIVFFVDLDRPDPQRDAEAVERAVANLREFGHTVVDLGTYPRFVLSS